MKYLFFAVETTDLSSRTAQLVSISCLTRRNGRMQTFSEYVLPTCPIDPRTTELHGISVCCGQLFVDDAPVRNAMSPAAVLTQFLLFVRSMQDYPREVLVLVAHGGFAFDSWVLCRNLVRFNVVRETNFERDFVDSLWFADSLSLARLSLPHLGDGGHGLDDLLWYFFGSGQAEMHDSMDDADDCRTVTVAMAHEAGESMGDFVCNWGKWISFAERLDVCAEEEEEQ